MWFWSRFLISLSLSFLLYKRLIITTSLENSYKTYSSCKVPSQVNITVVRESIPRQVDKKFGVPEEEKGVWGSQSRDGVWNSQGGGKDKHLFFSPVYSLVLVT